MFVANLKPKPSFQILSHRFEKTKAVGQNLEGRARAQGRFVTPDADTELLVPGEFLETVV